MNVTIMLDDQWQSTYDRARAEHGQDVVQELVTNWLKDRAQHHEDADIDQLKSGKADMQTKLKLKVRLGL